MKSRRKPYPTLKPGIKSLERDYYSKVTRNTPNGKDYYKNYNRFVSSYSEEFGENVKPKDYIKTIETANTTSKIRK